ncbi:MAG: SIS domain-containing protein [Chloroflexi bacterium]|nr:SIS domain-containing protein [Chloroflexota bacterium]
MPDPMDLNEASFGEHTCHEILTQGASWASALEGVRAKTEALGILLHRNIGRDLLFTACGSSYYLGLSVAALAQACLGVHARAVPASEMLLFPENMLAPGEPPLTIVASRSGETSEVIAVTRAMQARGAAVIAIGCDGTSTLLQLAQVGIEVNQGREVSIAQTRSFSGMFLATQALIALAAKDQAQMRALEQLPEFADGYIHRAWSTVEAVIAEHQIDRFFFLGSGVRYGLANEAMLKMKEMSLTSAEPFHFLEFRHGPISMVDEYTLVVGLVSEKAADYELAVLREIRNLGGQTLAIGEDASLLKASADLFLAFESGLPAPARDLLYVPPLQLLTVIGSLHDRATLRCTCNW